MRNRFPFAADLDYAGILRTGNMAKHYLSFYGYGDQMSLTSSENTTCLLTSKTKRSFSFNLTKS